MRTQRSVRRGGQGGKSLKDGIYRAANRRQSTFLRSRLRAVATEQSGAPLPDDPGVQTVAATKRAIREGYFELAKALFDQGEVELGRQTWRFAEKLQLARSDRERRREAVHHA